MKRVVREEIWKEKGVQVVSASFEREEEIRMDVDSERCGVEEWRVKW